MGFDLIQNWASQQLSQIIFCVSASCQLLSTWHHGKMFHEDFWTPLSQVCDGTPFCHQHDIDFWINGWNLRSSEPPQQALPSPPSATADRCQLPNTSQVSPLPSYATLTLLHGLLAPLQPRRAKYAGVGLPGSLLF